MPLKLGSNWKSCGPLYDMRRFMHGNTRVNIMMMTMKIRAPLSVVIMSDDKYIMIQCLSVTFLFIPALLPAQSCYVWIKPKVESRK